MSPADIKVSTSSDSADNFQTLRAMMPIGALKREGVSVATDIKPPNLELVQGPESTFNLGTAEVQEIIVFVTDDLASTFLKEYAKVLGDDAAHATSVAVVGTAAAVLRGLRSWMGSSSGKGRHTQLTARPRDGAM
jgi:hypothetical protein